MCPQSWRPLFSPNNHCSLEVRSDSRGRGLRTLAQVPMRMLTAGIKRLIILNSLMWLKCVLHLQVLHSSRYLLLKMFIPVILAPVEHVSVLL
jgi:hypothetical protein